MPALKLRSIDRIASLPQPQHESGFVPIPTFCDRATLAASALENADALLAQGLLEQAGERYQAAARGYDELGDAAGSARALQGLDRVLLGLEVLV